MVEVGKKAPAFNLESSDGGSVKLADLAGKLVVLYFYPRDNTPGCTVQAEAFREVSPELKKLGATVIGVSKDSIASHTKFRDKFKLNFPLLSDPEGKVLEAYGAWGDKVMYGKKMKGIIRSTVLIGADGKVAHHWPKVNVKMHAAEVVDAVKALAGGKPIGAAAPAKAAPAPAAPAPAKATPTAKATAAKATAAKKPATKKK